MESVPSVNLGHGTQTPEPKESERLSVRDRIRQIESGFLQSAGNCDMEFRREEGEIAVEGQTSKQKQHGRSVSPRGATTASAPVGQKSCVPAEVENRPEDKGEENLPKDTGMDVLPASVAVGGVHSEPETAQHENVDDAPVEQGASLPLLSLSDTKSAKRAGSSVLEESIQQQEHTKRTTLLARGVTQSSFVNFLNSLGDDAENEGVEGEANIGSGDEGDATKEGEKEKVEKGKGKLQEEEEKGKEEEIPARPKSSRDSMIQVGDQLLSMLEEFSDDGTAEAMEDYRMTTDGIAFAAEGIEPGECARMHADDRETQGKEQEGVGYYHDRVSSLALQQQLQKEEHWLKVQLFKQEMAKKYGNLRKDVNAFRSQQILSYHLGGSGEDVGDDDSSMIDLTPAGGSVPYSARHISFHSTEAAKTSVALKKLALDKAKLAAAATEAASDDFSVDSKRGGSARGPTTVTSFSARNKESHSKRLHHSDDSGATTVAVAAGTKGKERGSVSLRGRGGSFERLRRQRASGTGISPSYTHLDAEIGGISSTSAVGGASFGGTRGGGRKRRRKIINCVAVGDAGCGKTSLLQAIKEGAFELSKKGKMKRKGGRGRAFFGRKILHRGGREKLFQVFEVEVPDLSEDEFKQWKGLNFDEGAIEGVVSTSGTSVANKMCTVLFSDTESGEKFRAVRENSYSLTDVLLVCFSSGSQESVNAALDMWAAELAPNLSENAVVLVVETKTDRAAGVQDKGSTRAKASLSSFPSGSEPVGGEKEAPSIPPATTETTEKEPRQKEESGDEEAAEDASHQHYTNGLDLGPLMDTVGCTKPVLGCSVGDQDALNRLVVSIVLSYNEVEQGSDG